jgi:predicted regulator of Ras-like GTPase activity (Roadblock/LC7/MglB family)
MEEILQDVNAVVGVTGSFVCDSDGEMLARALPEVFDDAVLSPVARTMAQTVAGLHTARRRKVGDIDLLYADSRLIVKGLGSEGGVLGIICVRRINVPLLNLTADVAVGKLRQRIKEIDLSGAPVAATPAPAAAAAKAEQDDGSGPEDGRRMTRAEMMASTLRR